MKVEKFIRAFVGVSLFLLFISALLAQTSAGGLHGDVTDPSGAAIPGANVIMTPTTGSPIVIQSNSHGAYEFKSLPAGKYILTVAAQGFNLYENDNVVIADQPLRLNVAMAIEVRNTRNSGLGYRTDYRCQPFEQCGRHRDLRQGTRGAAR